MSLIWATRGRSWGFRFLLDGGMSDPLAAYEEVFSGAEGEEIVFQRVGDAVALRFPDPDGRTDHAGRVIPHDFVVSGKEAADVHSIDDGMRLIWPLVRDEFDRVWDAPSASAVAE